MVPLLAESFLAPLSSSDLEPLLILNNISSPLTKDFDIPGSPSLRQLLNMTSSAPTPKLKLAKHKMDNPSKLSPVYSFKIPNGNYSSLSEDPLVYDEASYSEIHCQDKWNEVLLYKLS